MLNCIHYGFDYPNKMCDHWIKNIYDKNFNEHLNVEI